MAELETYHLAILISVLLLRDEIEEYWQIDRRGVKRGRLFTLLLDIVGAHRCTGRSPSLLRKVARRKVLRIIVRKK